jgi:hypothetical protein
MWAVVINVDLDDIAVAKQELIEQVVPTLRQAPGFVGGYWIQLGERHGTSIAVFESEEQARATAPPKGSSSRGVTATDITFGEVLANA